MCSFSKRAMELNRYHVFCNTAQRSSGSPNDFSINLNPALVKTDPHSYFVVQVVSVEIPYSWFQINSTNNKITFDYKVSGGSTDTFVMTITEGNYTVTTLLTNFATQMDAVIPAHTWTHNLSYDANANKITFGIKSASAYASIDIWLKFQLNSFLARVFGCTTGSSINYGFLNPVYKNVVANQNCNVNPVSSIYIRSSNLRQVKNQENMVQNYRADPSDILCKLQVYTPPKSYIFYNGELGLTARLVNPVIDKIDLYLSDNYSFNLDMQNNEWSFRITFIEYLPFNLSDGYQQTKHLNGRMGEYQPRIQQAEPVEEPVDAEPEPDAPVIKKFQRE